MDGSQGISTTGCKYLGFQISWDKPTLTAIQHRISLARVAFSKLSPIWRSRVPAAVTVRSFQSHVVPALYILTSGLPSLTLEEKHFAKNDAWLYRYLRRAIATKASYYSRIPKKTVWFQAGKPLVPSQTILSSQFKQLTECLATPQDDPLYHVVLPRDT